jgi:excisionase family DNA binding protein
MREQQLLTVRQAAKLLGLAEDTLYSWVAARKIPVVRLGRAIRFRESDLQRMIADRTAPARNEI